MPTVPISMRKLKEILRIKYGAGLSSESGDLTFYCIPLTRPRQSALADN